MKLGRTRSDASGRHAAQYAQAEPEPAAEELPHLAESTTPAAEPGSAADATATATASGSGSSGWTGQTLFGAPSATPQPASRAIPDAGPSKPWLAKPSAPSAPSAPAGPAPVSSAPADDPAPPGDAPDDTAAPPPRTRSRRRAPSEPGTVLRLLAADIGGTAPEPDSVSLQKPGAARARPTGVPSAPVTAPAAAPLDVATVLAAERRLADLSRRLNDVEQRAEGERQSAVRRLEETERQLREARRELDAAVGLLAEHETRSDELESQVRDLTAQLAAEQFAKHDALQQSDVENRALAARLRSVEKRLAESVRLVDLERANHRQLLERAQNALTAESQARTVIEDRMTETTRAAEALHAQQAAEITRLNTALRSAIERRADVEAAIAQMEAGLRTQRDADARGRISAEQRLAETIASLESERARGPRRRHAAPEKDPSDPEPPRPSPRPR